MKFLPDAIGRKIGESSLLASEHAPKVLFVGGVVGMVGSTVLACRATLKLEEVLEEVESDVQKAHQAKTKVAAGELPDHITYTDSEYHKDLRIIKVRGIARVAKLYAPSVIVGAVSIAALTKSHNLLRDRNLALTAAYAAVEGAFARYRERVRDRYGEEVDREMVYDMEEIDIVDEETGEVISSMAVTDAPGSPYARWFDDESSRNFSKDPATNVYWLRTVQNYMNDRLKARGHVFLNEVYDDLGMDHTEMGAAVGWRFNKGSGDDRIDFGCWDRDEELNDFFNGREGAILLDFNVDGVIWDKIEEGK